MISRTIWSVGQHRDRQLFYVVGQNVVATVHGRPALRGMLEGERGPRTGPQPQAFSRPGLFDDIEEVVTDRIVNLYLVDCVACRNNVGRHC